MNAKERAEAIIKDVLINHLPRIQEGLEAGYVDENQILIVFDHAVRARILREHGSAICPNTVENQAQPLINHKPENGL